MQPFSKETVQKAKNISLLEYLQRKGVEMIKDGKYFRMKEHDSFVVNPESNLWSWNSRSINGKNAIDYLERIEKMTFVSAVSELLQIAPDIPLKQTKASNTSPPPDKPFALPPPAPDNRRCFAYLHKHRGILPPVINHFIKAGALYEGAKYHDAVFLGFDDKGIPCHAHKRSTNTYLPKAGTDGKRRHDRWDVESSDKRYGFSHVGKSNRVYVFEAPIDMLSYISIRILREDAHLWKEDNYICLFCLADNRLKEFLRFHPYIHHIVFCLDNDVDGKLPDGTPENHGQVAEDRLIAEYTRKGYDATRIVPPQGKDFNDALLFIIRTNTIRG
ncbi:DUF3991 domain-containing protein [Ethanoligenens sp.]|uniref:DUF3991 domain-containing protein n=1 Tax=Ethanoligenens sp. TaxID=2099655 RepID=UPI0039E892EF